MNDKRLEVSEKIMKLFKTTFFFILLLSLGLYAQDIEAIDIMGDSVIIVESVNLCSEIDLEGLAADDSFPDVTITGDFAIWERDFNYFLGDSCYWDYRCEPGHTFDGYDTSLHFKFVLWRYGFCYCGVYGDTTSALFLLCNGELKPVTTWGRPLTPEDILTGAFFTPDYSQNLIAQLIHHQYEMITSGGHIISGDLPVIRDRLCLDAPEDSTGVYLYGFNLLSFSLYNNLSMPIWTLVSRILTRRTDGTYSGCWYTGIPIVEGPYGVGYFIENSAWCALCEDSAGLVTGTSERGFDLHYTSPIKSAIRMRGGSNNLTEGWGYLDGVMRMHIRNCCTRDFASANYAGFDMFPDSVRLKIWLDRAAIGSSIRMAVIADSIWYSDVWESPSDGYDGNPPPRILKIEPGWNGTLHPAMEITPAETLDLGTIIIGESAIDVFDVTNIGDTTLVITTLVHSDSANFGVHYYAYTPPGSTNPIRVSFNPSSPGTYEDILVVYTNVPCYSLIYLYVKAKAIAVNPLIPEIVEPLPSTWTSCSDQQIIINALCSSGSSTEIGSLKVFSHPSTVEYFDSTSMSWEEPDSVWSSAWGSHIFDGTTWIWDDHFDYGECIDFRVILDLPEGISPDSASITLYADNQGTVYANGHYIDTTHSTYWYRDKTLNIAPYLNGGQDTITIRVCDLSGVTAGLDFYIVVFWESICCRGIDLETVVLDVDDHMYSGGDENIDIVDDTLIVFTPIAPDTFMNGDSIEVCLANAADTCGEIFDSLPLCWDFFVDLQPPIVQWNYPALDTIILDSLPKINLCIYDSLTGLDTSTVVLVINGDTVDYQREECDSCYAISWDMIVPQNSGDTVTYCIYGTDSTDYCPDNFMELCYRFFVVSEGPIAHPIIPRPEQISACEDGQIWIAIIDSQGIDFSSVVIAINQDTFYFSSPELSSYQDSILIFTPQDNYWQDKDSIYVSLLEAEDVYGAEMIYPLNYIFYTDFSAPVSQLISPSEEEWIRDLEIPLEFKISDAVSHLDIDSCSIRIDDSVSVSYTHLTLPTN